jgi:hypothetical protein
MELPWRPRPRLPATHRRPDIRVVKEAKRGGHDANHRVGFPFDGQGSSHRIARGAEPALSEALAHHDDVRRAKLALLRREPAARRRGNAQGSEEVVRNVGEGDTLRFGAARHGRLLLKREHRRKHLEAVGLLAVIVVVRGRCHGVRRAAECGAGKHQSGGVLERQRLQQSCVDDREHRCVRADAEGEGKGGDSSETGVTT